MHKPTILLACIAITACTEPTPDNYAYQAHCTNGTISDTFSVDGADWEDNAYTRDQAVEQLQLALNDDTDYQGTWTCK